MDKRFKQKILKKRGNPNGHKHMKICLTSFVIKEMQTKTTMRKRITLMVKILKVQNIKY